MVSSTVSIKAIASILSLLTVTNAHMIMKTPIPYGRGVINNSPLAADGSDYPCKNIFDLTDPVNDVNQLVPGVANTLSFTGSAVHGGGSCQVSLTTDLRPTKDSKWMVIKSIEGGCPANVPGNLPADPNGNGASTFEYTVPEGFPEGQYTIAWTWFNKIGNREMYMNCGRANIAGAKKRYAPAKPKPLISHRAADFPDILKAQLSIFTCTIPEGSNVAYPNPGADVQTVAPATTFCAGAADASSPSPTAGSDSGSSAAASSVAVTTGTDGGASPTGFASSGETASPSVATGAQSGGSLQTASPGVFASGASSPAAASATAAATSVATVVPVPAGSSFPAVSAPSATAVPSSGSSGNTSSTPSSGSNVAGSPCSDEGAWSCASDGKSFQRCASGEWSAPMQVAAGTSCTPGVSTDLSMSAVSAGGRKRDLISHIHGSQQHRRRLLFSS